MPDYKQIKIRADTFEMLKRGKDDGQSWSHYLKELREKEQRLTDLESRR